MHHKKICGLIQARMRSNRFPGKILKCIDGRPLLDIQIERLQQSSMLTHLGVVTTGSPFDDPIADFCKQLNIETPF